MHFWKQKVPEHTFIKGHNDVNMNMNLIISMMLVKFGTAKMTKYGLEESEIGQSCVEVCVTCLSYCPETCKTCLQCEKNANMQPTHKKVARMPLQHFP